MTSKAFPRVITILLVVIAFLLVQFWIHRLQQENVRNLVIAEEMRYNLELQQNESLNITVEHSVLDKTIEEQKKQIATLEFYFVITQVGTFVILVLLSFNIVNILKQEAIRVEQER
ncbi:MAG: hypothetical protein ACRC2T_00925, partial [Thermoguttaceae bacterium]